MRKTILATALIAFAFPAWAGDNFDGAGGIGSGGYSGGGGSRDLYEFHFTNKYKAEKDQRNALLMDIMRSGGLRSVSSDPGGAPNHGECVCGK